MSQPLQHPRFQSPALGRPPIRAPLFSHKVPAGFPSPADDYVEDRLSLDESLIPNKDFTFFVRARGHSMIGAGIFDGDLLVVDKSLEPAIGNIVIAVVNGELTVKRLARRGGAYILKAENPEYNDIELRDGQELQIWGVVTSSIKKHG